VHVTAPTPVCTPFKGNTLPSSISLTNKADGLTKLVDSPQHYQVYGNNPATIRAQIRQCAPKSGNGATEYAAETSYHITWQYNVVDAGEGKCQIAHAKVGVHVAQVMPLWQPSLDVQSGLASQWQAFMNSLITHENGHTDIDVQYAQTLLDDLNSFPATSCAQLAQAVKYLTDSDIAILDQANDNYDSSTNHGATQGAILP
jgi:predicted secreted Zn-dependent protease